MSGVWLALTAIVDRTTIMKMPMMSSTTSEPNTSSVNFLPLRPRSSKALMIIVVDEMANMPPKKRLEKYDHPSAVPHSMPAAIMSAISVTAVMTAALPTLSSRTMLNSRPRPNIRKITPISDHVEMPSESATLGNQSTAGPIRKPATT